MRVRFSPSHLNGRISVPPSKSLSHRAILCAALAKGTSRIDNLIFSKDILATLDAVKALGADYRIQGNSVAVTGIQEPPTAAEIDCCESGSTLRFLIPIASALGVRTTYRGEGKLPSRPITPYLIEMTRNGVTFDYQNTMPFTTEGQLKIGTYTIDGDISSQFVTGLLFALPLLEGSSVIRINGRLESKPYAEMTIAMLARCGIRVNSLADGYEIPGGQQYQPLDYRVEGDYSQAAFYAVAAACRGGDLILDGLLPDSPQGDREILSIVQECGAGVRWEAGGVSVCAAKTLRPFTVDAADIPDLVPILGVLAGCCAGRSVITGAKRLKIKESDRLAAISSALNALGGKLTPFEDRLEIEGTGGFRAGTADSCNDHRIAMSVAVAALLADGPVELTCAQSVRKSYPDFYQDYQILGGKADVIDVE